METLGSCVLIGFNPDAHEAGSAAEEIRREVKITVKDVGLNEFYQATGLGLRPEKRILIPYERDYRGERELEFNGRRWRVIRATGGEYNGVLLTIQPWDGNAGRAAQTAGTGTAGSGTGTGGGSAGEAGSGSSGGTEAGSGTGSETGSGSGSGGNGEQTEPVDVEYDDVTVEPAG